MQTELVLADIPQAQLDLVALGARVRSLMLSAGVPIVEELRAISARRFDANGPGWAALAASTVAGKEAKGQDSSKILVATGALRAAMTSAAPGTVTDITPVEIYVGTDIDYAHWHQDGGTIAGRPPQRPLVDLSEEDVASLTAIMRKAMAGL